MPPHIARTGHWPSHSPRTPGWQGGRPRGRSHKLAEERAQKPSPSSGPFSALTTHADAELQRRKKWQQLSESPKSVHPCFYTHTLSLCLSLSLPIEHHHLKLGLSCQPGSCVAERKVIYSKVWPLTPPCNSRQLHFQIDLFLEKINSGFAFNLLENEVLGMCYISPQQAERGGQEPRALPRQRGALVPPRLPCCEPWLWG